VRDLSLPPSHIFREYDIRGIAETDFTPEAVEIIGRSYAFLLRESLPSFRASRPPRIAVARDVRASSPSIAAALIQGIRGQGIDILNLGVCPTPLLYFSLFQLEVEGGVVVTGSHNAPEYNGMKICVGREALHGPSIQRLREIAREPSSKSRSRKGGVQDYPIIPHYLAWMNDHFQSLVSASSQANADSPEAIKVVIDAGNGTGGLVGPALLRSLGCRVVELYCEPDGSFPHHHPDPTIPQNLEDLIARVKAEHAHLGIAYDGDADRIGVVDATGQPIWGDQLMLLFARDILSSQTFSPEAPPIFIGEVKCSQVLYDEIERLGGRAKMSRTGHSLIKQLMKESSAVLAGEMSGHLFFADRYFGYDDALYASARLIEIMVRERSTLAELLGGLPPTFATPEIRLDCPEDRKFKMVAQIGQSLNSDQGPPPPFPIQKIITTDGLRIVLDQGWALLRASNTQPALVLRFEASSPQALDQIKSWMEGLVHKMKRRIEIED